MLELIWNVTEEATEWFGDSDPNPGTPCLIARSALERTGSVILGHRGIGLREQLFS